MQFSKKIKKIEIFSKNFEIFRDAVSIEKGKKIKKTKIFENFSKNFKIFSKNVRKNSKNQRGHMPFKNLT